jgi:hypothetical protein
MCGRFLYVVLRSIGVRGAEMGRRLLMAEGPQLEAQGAKRRIKRLLSVGPAENY